MGTTEESGKAEREEEELWRIDATGVEGKDTTKESVMQRLT